MSQQLSAVEQNNKERIQKYWEMRPKLGLNFQQFKYESQGGVQMNWRSVSDSQLSDFEKLNIQRVIKPI